MRPLQHTACTQHHLQLFRHLTDHGDDHIRLPGDIRAIGSDRDAVGGELLRPCAQAVVYRQGESGLQDIVRHGRTHRADADKPYSQFGIGHISLRWMIFRNVAAKISGKSMRRCSSTYFIEKSLFNQLPILSARLHVSLPSLHLNAPEASSPCSAQMPIDICPWLIYSMGIK